MEHKFAFGYEAIKPVLAALGIDPDNKAFAIQRVVVDMPHNEFPTVHLYCAPESVLFADPEAVKGMAGGAVHIQRSGAEATMPIHFTVPLDLLRKAVREEVARAIVELTG